MTETVGRRISNSEIQTFKECRRKWWLAWHRGLTPVRTERSGALALGSRVHAALASYYVPSTDTAVDPRVRIRELLEEDRAALRADQARWWEESTEEFGQLERPERTALHVTQMKKFNDEADLQLAMIDGYVDWIENTGDDQYIQVLESESYVELPFSITLMRDVILIGRLDVRIRNLISGEIEFLDHKTTGSIPELLRELRMSEQMKMYRLLLTALPGARVGGATYNILRKVKRTRAATPPFFQRHTIRFNPVELRTFTDTLRGVINVILDTEERLRDDPRHHVYAYPTRTRDCSWKCPFDRICPLFDDGSRAEALVAVNFEERNPLEYYGQEELTRHG